MNKLYFQIAKTSLKVQSLGSTITLAKQKRGELRRAGEVRLGRRRSLLGSADRRRQRLRLPGRLRPSRRRHLRPDAAEPDQHAVRDRLLLLVDQAPAVPAVRHPELRRRFARRRRSPHRRPDLLHQRPQQQSEALLYRDQAGCGQVAHPDQPAVAGFPVLRRPECPSSPSNRRKITGVTTCG